MRRPTIAPALALAAVLATAGCADNAPEVALPAAPATPTTAALDGHLSGGELADARRLLETLDDRTSARRRPDLVAVAQDSFACWQDAAQAEPRLGEEAVACRADFWGAMHALTPLREIAAR